MSDVDRRIQEFELRPAACDSAEAERRAALLEHFSSINRFEGIVPSASDQRLFALLASGKISKAEYLDLCLADARPAAT